MKMIKILILLPCFLLSACATQIDPETSKMSGYVNYPDQLPHATIRGGVAPHCAFSPGISAIILSIDGKKFPQKFWFQDDKWNISPGFHTVRVAADGTPYIPVKMQFNAKAGEDYKVIVNVSPVIGKGIVAGSIRNGEGKGKIFKF